LYEYAFGENGNLILFKSINIIFMQTTSNIMMIRPINFGFNEQTATSNAFQNKAFGEANKSNAQIIALQEFDSMVDQLKRIGVNVIVIEDTLDPSTPDSIFPNCNLPNAGRKPTFGKKK
jgi:hypothetical protein